MNNIYRNKTGKKKEKKNSKILCTCHISLTVALNVIGNICANASIVILLLLDIKSTVYTMKR